MLVFTASSYKISLKLHVFICCRI